MEKNILIVGYLNQKHFKICLKIKLNIKIIIINYH